MSPEAARDIARSHKALADLYLAAGDRTNANRQHQDSQWWTAKADELETK